MSEHFLVGLSSIIVLGIAAQWIAWRFRLPAILLLLIFGFIAGPLTGILDPGRLFGDLLYPLISVSVAIILFEGGLSLKITELRKVGLIVRNLTTLAILITWVMAAVAAHFIVGIALTPAILLGAVMVVSGPTVIVPLLRHVRPIGRVGSIVKWEGIVNDPIGAVLAVLVFEAVISGGGGTAEASSQALLGALKSAFFGGIIGILGAGVLILLLKRYLIPDFLQNPVSLMVVVICYALANVFQSESGLLSVTLMGIALTNQKYVSIRQISEFKENLRVLIISSLFIILAAELSFEQLSLFNIRNWLFVAALIIVVRPLAVFASTAGFDMKLNEKLFLSWMAPRGIVAAAVVSVFALRLSDVDYPGFEVLVPLTFQVIIGTVAIYGLTAVPVARWLRVARPNPQGVLFGGAQPWARQLALIIQNEGHQVAVIDSNYENIRAARNDGLKAYYASILSERLLYELQLDGIGRFLALTPNDEVNSLASLHFSDIFGSHEVYQLIPETARNDADSKEDMPKHLYGRFLFSRGITYDVLTERFKDGAMVKKTPITQEFGFDDFRKMYGDEAVPFFIATDSGLLRVYTADEPPQPRPGDNLISLVFPEGKNKPDES